MRRRKTHANSAVRHCAVPQSLLFTAASNRDRNIPLMPQLPILFSREQIAKRVAALGAQITHDFAGQPIIFVGVLRAASVSLRDLARLVERDAPFDLTGVSRYALGPRSRGQV